MKKIKGSKNKSKVKKTKVRQTKNKSLRSSLAGKLKITKDMNVSKIAEVKPEAVDIMFDSGLHCIGCPFSMAETLEQGAKSHGFTDKEIDEMVSKINAI